MTAWRFCGSKTNEPSVHFMHEVQFMYEVQFMAKPIHVLENRMVLGDNS